jgi:carboxylesterase type B
MYTLIQTNFPSLLDSQATAEYVNLAHNAKYPTWYYYYNASFPNIQPYPDSGVYHASEIQMVFGTHGKTRAPYGSPPSTAQQIALSRFMTNAWANFARNPHGGPGWPEVGTIKEDVAVIGPWGMSGVQMVENVQSAIFSQMVEISVVASKCHTFT